MPIYKDKAGIIWLGTGGGVSRHDGKSFQSFTTSDGLSNNDVHAILQDQTGKIWFGTRGDITIYATAILLRGHCHIPRARPHHR